jgi:hypothetical protein
MKCRTRLTKVEAALLGLIAATIAGLVLPAIIRAREASAISRSRDNLKRIALACHAYSDAHKNRLPPLLDIGEGAPTGGGMQSLFFHILPYVNEQRVYDALNQAAPDSYFNKSHGVAQNIVPAFLSPADTTSPDGAVTSQNVPLLASPAGPYAQSFTGWYATTSYAANGMIPWNVGGIPRTFVDGTSNTIVFAERPQTCVDAAADRTVYNLWGYGYYGPSTPAFALLTPAVPQGLPSTDQIAAATPLPTTDPDLGPPVKYEEGQTRTVATLRRTRMMPVRIGREDAAPQPSPVTRSFQLGLTRGGPCDSRLAGSPHPDAMIVALADGSVSRFKPTLTDWFFWAECTPNGNEIPFSDWGY